MDRVKALEQFIAASPSDPFPRYGLAMEHKNAGHLGRARDAFAELVERFPSYVATYLMFGNTLEALGEPAEALRIYAAGIDVARAAGNAHALGELEAAHAGVASRG